MWGILLLTQLKLVVQTELVRRSSHTAHLHFIHLFSNTTFSSYACLNMIFPQSGKSGDVSLVKILTYFSLMHNFETLGKAHLR